MKFEDYTYERPNLEEIKPIFNKALQKFKAGSDVSEQVEAIREINDIRLTIDTMQNICYIRHSIDTND